MRLVASCFLAFICCIMLAWPNHAAAIGTTPIGTEFTFQGKLTTGGAAIDGNVDLKFRLFDAATDGTQVGAELEALSVFVADGTFTVDLDFGSGAFVGGKRWLEIDVRHAGDPTYETLSPRQPIVPAPIAQIALNGGSSPFMFTGPDATFTDGNVGIGTTTPQSKLEVRGDSAWPLRVSGTTNAGIRLESDGTASSWAIYHDSSSDNLAFRDSTTGATRMSITGDNGNVGIGTTNPLSNLHIAPTSGSASFAMIGAGEPVGLSLAVGNNGLAIGKRDADGSNFEYLGRWTFDGKLGVGTDSPTAKLHISDPGNGGSIRISGDDPVISLENTGSGGRNYSIYALDGNLQLRDAVAGTPRLLINPTGNVGIGTTDPAGRLDVVGQTITDTLSVGSTAGSPTDLYVRSTLAGVDDAPALFSVNYNNLSALTEGLRLSNRNLTGAVGLGLLGGADNVTDLPKVYLGTFGGSGQNDFRIVTNNAGTMRDRLFIDGDNGNVGIGTTSPQAGLSVTKVNTQIDPTVMGVHLGMIPYADDSGAAVTIAGGAEGAQLRFYEIGGENANARLWYQPSTNDIRFDGGGLSKVSVPILEIRGGADIVEGFDTSHDEALEPGTVVVIDPENAGALMESAEAYDFKVAGVVSGANGVAPGIHLGQDDVMDGDTKVAMTGRVYVKCSAENGAIKPGTLLTTASLPGHAMAATDAARSNGAVIGKAMSSLDEGTGLVLVLVNLQ